MNSPQNYYNQNQNYRYYAQQQPQYNQRSSNSSKKVSFGESVSSFWKNYGNFNGTTSRSTFWKWFWMEYVIDIIVFLFIKNRPNVSLAHPATILGAFGFTTIWWLVIVIPNLSLRIRRFRDAGVPKVFGYVLLGCDDLAEFVPAIGPAIFYAARAVTIFFECCKSQTPKKSGKQQQTMTYNHYSQQPNVQQNYNNYNYQQNQYRQYRQ